MNDESTIRFARFLGLPEAAARQLVSDAVIPVVDQPRRYRRQPRQVEVVHLRNGVPHTRSTITVTHKTRS